MLVILNEFKDSFIDQVERRLNENTSFYFVPNNQSAFERLRNQVNNTKFTWTQFYLDSKDEQV